MTQSPSLRYASLALIAGAALHFVAIFLGAEFVQFLGAPPEIVESFRNGTAKGPVSTGMIAAFLLFLGYLTGKKSRGKPARIFLFLCAVVFIARGILGGLFVPALLDGGHQTDPLFFWFHVGASIFVLSIGIAISRGLYITKRGGGS